MEGNYCWRKKIFSFTHSLSHVGAPPEGRKRYRMSISEDRAGPTDSSCATRWLVPLPFPTWPFSPAHLHSPATTCLPLRWGGILHSPFPLLASQCRLPKKGPVRMVVSWCGYLSLKTGIKPANSFQVCPPKNHGAAFSLGWSVLLRLLQHCPFGCPSCWGGRETSWRLVPTAVLPNQAGNWGGPVTGVVERGRWEQQDCGGEGCSPHTPSLPPAGFSPARVSEQQCSTSGLKGCQSAGNPTLWPGEGGEGPLATSTSLCISLLKANSSNPSCRR